MLDIERIEDGYIFCKDQLGDERFIEIYYEYGDLSGRIDGYFK